MKEPGSVNVTEWDFNYWSPFAQRYDKGFRQPVHVFSQSSPQSAPGNLDSDTFLTKKAFIIYPEENHILLLTSYDSLAESLLYKVTINSEGRVVMNTNERPMYMALRISLMATSIKVSVKPNCTLKLLLNSARFEVCKFILTDKQYRQLRDSTAQTRIVNSAISEAIVGEDTRRNKKRKIDSCDPTFTQVFPPLPMSPPPPSYFSGPFTMPPPLPTEPPPNSPSSPFFEPLSP